MEKSFTTRSLNIPFPKDDPRITSYNVCYTKLLRESFPQPLFTTVSDTDLVIFTSQAVP